MLSDAERRFLAHRRVGYLATADAGAVPHVVPVCFAVSEDSLYITLDDKPKRQPAGAAKRVWVGTSADSLYIAVDDEPERQPASRLKRMRNIAENPAVAVVVDRYAEDWTLLGWVMLRGRADVLGGGEEHHAAQALLRSRYPQYEAMDIGRHPVIAVRIERAVSWGNLSVPQSP